MTNPAGQKKPTHPKTKKMEAVMNEMRVFVKENATGYTRYYYANRKLIQAEHETVFDNPTFEQVALVYGENGANLYFMIDKLANHNGTPFNFSLYPEYLKVTRNPAVEWSEIDSAILEAIEYCFGKFMIQWEPAIKVFIQKMRRLLAKD
jgi:hypothetical protein